MTNTSDARRQAGEPQMRASDADRDAAADLLSAAFAQGRLTANEHDERLSAAHAARNWQQLRQLTADLPPTASDAGRKAASGMAAEPDRCLIFYLLLIAFPPAGIAWWLLSRRSPDADPPGRLTAANGLAVTTKPLLSDRAGARCC